VWEAEGRIAAWRYESVEERRERLVKQERAAREQEEKEKEKAVSSLANYSAKVQADVQQARTAARMAFARPSWATDETPRSCWGDAPPPSKSSKK
jgi:ribosome-binding ATPase YchF (GTP1/OBG family)